MKNILKKSISLVICVALMLTAIPMMFASAEDTAIPEPLQLATGRDEPGFYHPGGFSACDKTFDAQIANASKWFNNIYLRNDTGFDLSSYNAIQLNFWYEQQDAYGFWKDYIFFIVTDVNGAYAAYPVDASYDRAAVHKVTLDLDYAAAYGVDTSAINRIGLRSLNNGWFRNQKNNWDCGFFTEDETIPDFHFSLTDFKAVYIPEAEGTVEIHPGKFAFYDAEAVNRDYEMWIYTMPEAVDVSSCDYISYKVNMSDIEALKADMGSQGTANLFTSLNFRIGTDAGNVVNIGPGGYIADGYNEILIPVSSLGAIASSVQYFQMWTEPHAGNGNVPTQPYMYGITDIKGVKDVVPGAIVARENVTIPVDSQLTQVTMSNYLQDRYYRWFDAPVDISGGDYIEFDYWVNSDVYAAILEDTNDLQISFGSDAGTLYAGRLMANIGNQIKNTGWNHIVLRIDAMTREAGNDLSAIRNFFVAAGGAYNASPLWVNVANVCATVHAGDVNGDTDVNINDLIRMKKALAKATADYDALALDVNNDGAVDAAADLVYLRQFLLGMVEL